LDVSFFILASKRHLKCEKNLYTIKDEDKVSIQSYMEGGGGEYAEWNRIDNWKK